MANTSPTTGGTDLKNGTNSTQNVQYNVGTGNRYDVANITFSDTETNKRFEDITVSVLNCGTTTDNDLTMLQWAERAGFSAAQLTAIQALPNGGTLGGDATPTTLPNGVQAHKDQSGNIFLSGDFGTDAGSLDGRNRWMLNNLAATSFATGARTGVDVNVSVNLPASPSASVDNYKNPLWTYPNISGNGTSATLYNNNPRLGRLYNWAAATNSKGSTFDNGANDAAYANGQKPYSDGEIAPATDPQTARRQGICPNGWHLPSDYEWTQLEQEINTHTSQYAAIPDANGTITVGQAANRGSTHGQGMKDVCPAPTSSIASNGASNIINDTTMRPGFSAMSVGHASGGVVGNYGGFANFWSASGVGATNVWHRYISSANAQMNRITNARYSFESVRCKKD
ncbi:FISUMP domain-containing protein [Dysgonomonas sp. 25]|uniref:FISUMP domain-containing protein n=1 Tax=Dysgonomonas sp. 25 TaxID=2302933 RepID=UPI0013D3FD3A|nr:FISUMP domain-containing protein [Dysgonomonas sp. 25]NDV68786.1 hypothetical protein [Dysgonomonas sp. 25]NDV70180.1 hypothetical protein [Dysgonomonas sp. 25]